MKLRLLVLCCALFRAVLVVAQDPVAQKYGNMITPTDLKEYLSIIASDAFEGRETGKRGQKIAAAFISAHFQEIGLTPPVNGSYYQPIELFTAVPGEIYIKTTQSRFDNYNNIIYYGTADSGGEVSAAVVFVGKGLEKDFTQVDVKDKIALIMDGDFRAASNLAREKGAKMIFLFNSKEEEYKQIEGQIKSYTSDGVLSLNRPEKNSKNAGVFFIALTVAEKIINSTVAKLQKAANEDLKKIKPVNIAFKTSIVVKTLPTENVLGYLEGTDKKNELIVVTAHYDHIGKKKGEGDVINNGADDDGSGTVSVLEMAKVFAQAKKDGKGPRRSILFMTVTGEEKGLLGSDYYTQHPVFPLANTVVDLNIDMVGRRDAQHKDSAPYVYVIGSDKLSTELHNINEQDNKTYTNLIFDYTYNDEKHPERLYYRSDHWNFAKNNIPIIFYFDGIHEDYHKPSDEVDKIEFDLLAKRAQCVFYTAWDLANRDQRIMPDKKN